MARPRAFDEEEALDRAMELFWRHGYEGTSLSDLTAAMGINRPSLYAAFGNKEALFQRVIERYIAGPAAGLSVALALPTAREAIETMLRYYAEAPGVAGRPAGCLLVNAALRCSAESVPVRASLSRHRVASMTALRRRFERARREGEVPAEASPADLARYFWTVLEGMAVQATDGATTAQLREVARLAMLAWPAGRLHG